MESLYLSVSDAAEYVGIGVKTMRDYVNSKNPPPYMKVGNKVMLQKSELERYFEEKQEVRATWR